MPRKATDIQVRGKETKSIKEPSKETERETMETDVKTFSEEPAWVRYNNGATINLGNYQSARIDIAITMPCKSTNKEITKVLNQIIKKVDKKIGQLAKNYAEEENVINTQPPAIHIGTLPSVPTTGNPIQTDELAAPGGTLGESLGRRRRRLNANSR